MRNLGFRNLILPLLLGCGLARCTYEEGTTQPQVHVNALSDPPGAKIRIVNESGCEVFDLQIHYEQRNADSGKQALFYAGTEEGQPHRLAPGVEAKLSLPVSGAVQINHYTYTVFCPGSSAGTIRRVDSSFQIAVDGDGLLRITY